MRAARALAGVLASTSIVAPAIAQSEPAKPDAPSAEASPLSRDTSSSQPNPARMRAGGAVQQEDDPRTFRLRLLSGYAREADLESGGGFARGLVGAALEGEARVGKQTTLSMGLSASRLIYAFDRETTILPGGQEPWDGANFFGVSVGGGYAFDQQWRSFASISVNSAGEENADFGESLTYGGVAGFTYSSSKTLTLGLGLAARSRLEDDAFVLPFPILQWDFDEQWRFYIGGSSVGGSAAAGIGFAYTPDPAVTLSLGFGGFGLGGEFRLDENGPIPGGVARDNFSQLVLGLDWRPHERVTVSAFAGATFFGELEILDNGGVTIYESDVDNGPVFGLSVGIGF